MGVFICMRNKAGGCVQDHLAAGACLRGGNECVGVDVQAL